MIEACYRPIQPGAVFYGQTWRAVVGAEIERLGAQRVVIIASRRLAEESNLANDAREVLGARLAGLITGIGSHAPQADVVSAACRARTAGADFILAIGGGSVIDAAKLVLLCLSEGIKDTSMLGGFADGRNEHKPRFPVRMGCVPTTLSGAEFTHFGGATDQQRQVKERYTHPHMIPAFVILDPAVTLQTPMDLWLSTGIRAFDHAIEALCSTNSNIMAEATAIGAIERLARSLPQTLAMPQDVAARLDSQCGMWLSAIGLQSDVAMGASHGIGHALGGTAGVPHGVTSCLMLPHVLRWNEPVTTARQRTISRAMGNPDAGAADLVADLVRRLGLPSRLRDVGIGLEQLEQLGTVAFNDPWTRANPRLIESPAAVVSLLKAAW